MFRRDHQKYGSISDTLREIIVASQVIDPIICQVIGSHCLYCLLSLLRLTFKAYKDLIPFMFFFHMYMLYE